MAIGDAIGVKLGTATTNYQPSSGVEVQISSFHKQNTTDALTIYDGSDVTNLVDNALATSANVNPAAGWMNSSVMITNSIYLRKTGTTDYVYVTGVQTNA
jgi:hypothetical protein